MPVNYYDDRFFGRDGGAMQSSPRVSDALEHAGGNVFYVNETLGSDSGLGTSNSPFRTLQHAHDACTAGNNDVVYFSGTMHQSTSLLWSKSQTHLKGIGSPLRRGKRARISVSGTTPFSYLVDCSAAGCLFENFGTFYGFPTVGATVPVCWRDTGGRNAYENVEFLGFGNDASGTATAAQTTARAFLMSGSTGEVTWRKCVFGVDTAVRNATNYTVEFAGGAPRCHMEQCTFEADLGSSGAAAAHILIGTDGIDRYLMIEDSMFLNSTLGGPGATAMNQALVVPASPGGMVYLKNCQGFGFTNWETTSSGNVVMFAPAIVGSGKDAGIALPVTP